MDEGDFGLVEALEACVRRLEQFMDDYPEVWDGVSQMVLSDAKDALEGHYRQDTLDPKVEVATRLHETLDTLNGLG